MRDHANFEMWGDLDEKLVPACFSNLYKGYPKYCYQLGRSCHYRWTYFPAFSLRMVEYLCFHGPVRPHS